MLGCWLPIRSGTSPPMRWLVAWLMDHEMTDPSSDVSMRCPRPEPLPSRPSPSRHRSAARIATAPSIPVVRSAMATPTLVGAPPSASGMPVMDISPETAWMMKSKPGRSLSGPVRP